MLELRVLYFDPRPGPKMLFQGDAPEGSYTFQWPVIERDRVGGLRLMIWDKVKVPLCHYSVHRKRVTSELHDSYFRLMTIKHSISKIQWAIVWALNYYIIELSWVPKQLSVEFQRVRDEMWLGKPHPTEGALGKPRWSGPQHQENKKDSTWRSWQWGQNMKFMFGLQHPLICKPLNNPFEPLQ